MTLASWKPDDPNSDNKHKLIIYPRNHNHKNQKIRIIEDDHGKCELLFDVKSLGVIKDSKENGAHLKFKNR